MSIAIERLKRAIADLPKGGMQTGDYKVKLKLADAQRAIAELEGLKAERDALAAQAKALKDLAEFWINQAKPYQPSEQEYKTWLSLGYESKALRSTPQQCLAEIRAEAVDDVWKKLYHRWKSDTYGDSAFVRVSEIKEMANAIRQGGAE